MQHFIFHPTNSTFACGADAVGRRNTRLDTDPWQTSCGRCIEAMAAANRELPAGTKVEWNDLTYRVSTYFDTRFAGSLYLDDPTGRTLRVLPSDLHRVIVL